MKRRWIELTQDILLLQLNHWIFVVVLITILNVLGENNLYLPLWMMLGTVPVLLHFLRINLQKKSLLYISHLLLIALCILFPLSPIVKTMMVACVFMYTIRSISIRSSLELRTEKLLSPVYFAIAIIISNFLERFHTRRSLEILYLTLLMTYFIGYVIYYFISRYLNFMRMNEHSASNIPEQEIFFFGMKHSAMFAGGSVFFLILTANLDWFSKIMTAVGNRIVELLSFLFRNVRYEYVEVQQVEEIVESAQEPYFELFIDFEFVYVILRIIDKILNLVAIVFVISMILNISKGIYDFFRQKLLLNGPIKASKYQSNQDVREYCAVDSNKKENTTRLFLNNREKIRRIFRKRILKNKTEIIGDRNPKILEYLTAKECCDKLSAENLKTIYEKARYSAEDITMDDVRKIKR